MGKLSNDDVIPFWTASSSPTHIPADIRQQKIVDDFHTLRDIDRQYINRRTWAIIENI